MIDTGTLIDMLVNYGYERFVGVPCSNLSSFFNEAMKRNIYTPFANEGDAVAFAAGQHLAGKRCAVLMQNSGLTNAMSPLSSLTELFKIPILLIIGNRGGTDDEPQHKIMSNATTSLLDSLGILYFDIKALPENLMETASKRSVALLVGKNAFTPVAKQERDSKVSNLPIRYDILKKVSEACGKSLIFSTTGFTSRELYCIEDRAENFYMVGSMGCVSSLALGAALANPDRPVIAIDGDGACMMRFGAMVNLAQIAPPNLMYIVLDNNSYESTGDLPSTVGDSVLLPLLNALYPTLVAIAEDDITSIVEDFASKRNAYTQVYIKIRTGTMTGLPRPDREEILNQVPRFIDAAKGP